MSSTQITTQLKHTKANMNVSEEQPVVPRRVFGCRPVRTISAEAFGAYDYGPNGDLVPYVYRGKEETTGPQEPFAYMEGLLFPEMSYKPDEAQTKLDKRAKFGAVRAIYWDVALSAEDDNEELTFETPEDETDTHMQDLRKPEESSNDYNFIDPVDAETTRITK